MEIIYATTKYPFAEGKVFRNPSRYLKPDEDAARVYIVWGGSVQQTILGKISAEYTARGVDVTILDPVHHKDVLFHKSDAPPAAASDLIAKPIAERHQPQASVPIPDDWQQMPWADLRRLAASVSARPIINKDEAFAAIETALAARKGT